MVITTTKVLNAIQWLITVFLISSFLLFDTYTWGKYSFIVCAVLIFLLTIVKNRGRIRLRPEPFFLLFFAFTVYVVITAIWAITPSDTITMARTLFRILICYSLIYMGYMYDPDPLRMITAIIAASYIVSAYSIMFFGFENIINSSDEVLRNGSYANINNISMFLAFGCICDIYVDLFHRFRLYSLLSLMSVSVIAAMRTRKAIVFLVIGVIFLLVFRFSKSQSRAYRILRVVSIIILALIGLYFLSKLPMFAGVNERLNQMVNTFMNFGEMDNASVIRQKLARLGVFCWLRRPINGIGMASTHAYATLNLGIDSYLHNNYVELLAGGGVIAFLIYYSIYVYLIYGYFKIRKTSYKWFAFGIIMIGLLLISDYGRVSYYSKPVLFELMTLYLIMRTENENRKNLADNVEDHEVSVRR